MLARPVCAGRVCTRKPHENMEMNRRMSTRSTWLLGVLILIAIGVLVACGSHYSASSDGLVVASTQGTEIIQTYSFNLSNGHTAAINHPVTPTGQPSAIVMDPAGAFAYVILTENSAINGSATGIGSFKVNSDGTLTSVATATLLDSVVPVAIAMDSAGKFLFVADGTAGAVSVLTIASGGSLSEVAGSPFPVPSVAGGTTANLVALAPTPTVLPTLNTASGSLNAACTQQVAPATEYLYVADAANNTVWDFQVDMSSGVLSAPDNDSAVPGAPTGSVPSGVAVDACNRFVYVANQNSNNISGYTICNGTNTSSPTCQANDGSLVSVGAAVSAGSGPTAMAIDPLGNFLYVVGSQATTVNPNALFGYRISQVTGVLSALNPPSVATGTRPVAIAIRADDNWVFVANYGSATISQYALTPATGALSPAGTGIATDNFPAGVAVK
jgi:6-phosphogluconolactonase (cycloisomerase 2 family)